MAKIERFIVSHRSGCGLCDPVILKTAEECSDYIINELVKFIDEHVNENFDENSDEYKEYNNLKTNDEKYEWGEDHNLICDYSFTGNSDWEEYTYSSTMIDVSDAEFYRDTLKDRKISQTEAKVFKTTMIGKKYRHFKGNIYVIDNIAVHSETGELRVIYHSDDNPENVWDRNLEMFLSPVDKDKYPDVKQELRFEPIN